MKRLFILLGMVFSVATVFSQNITKAEYFIDSDPGQGKGTPITNFASGDTVNFSFTIPTTTLSDGFHFLATRVYNAEGKWSRYETRGFYLSSTTAINTANIVAAEYFYDVDAGVGKGSLLVVTIPGSTVNQTFSIPVPNSLSQGKHFLGIRVKDQGGNWSLFKTDSLTVGLPSGSITCPGNVTVNPFTNDCKAAVYSIDAVGLPSNDSSYTYTLTGATTGNGIGTASGKLFNAGITTVKYALISSPTVSCSFTVTVNSGVTPTVAISVSNTPFCQGTLKTFSSIYTNAGSSSTIWQWKKNGINVGTNNATYRDSTLQNNDTMTLAMTSAISCAVPKTVTSAPVIMTVRPRVIPSVSITASATTICPGQSVTFTATPTNGGNPVYEWIKNGAHVGGTSIYQTSTLANGDSVYVILYNTTDCIPDSDITSNVIHITVAQAVTPSVTIAQSPTIICSGTIPTFTATPVNGGSTPTYQWKVNDINVGNNSNTYTPSTAVNGNVVKVIMTSSLGCASSPSATSNSITMIVNDSLQEFVSVTASATTICAGTVVTFSAAESGGGSGTFQWQLNGNNVGTNSLIYRTDSLHNGDKVKVVFASTFACSLPAVSSNEITITVNSASTPSVSILASATNICAGQQVTFTATPVNGGASPSYQWKLNGNNVGNNSPTYQSSSLQNGDKIKVVITSSSPCSSPSPVTSNEITMAVNSGEPASVTIAASQTTICAGQSVTFTSTLVNGGTSPTYEWTLNGSVVGSDTSVYQTNSLKNGDVVRLTMQPYGSCAGNNGVYSNSITMTVTTAVVPSVTINASAIDICSGQQVTFTANALNGGSNAHYQWKLNGINVGGDSAIFKTSALANADTVKVVMSSSLGCANPQSVTSNNISMDVVSSVIPSVSINASTTTICAGAQVTFTATPTNGGTPHYEWVLNGNEVGTNSNIYQSSTLKNGDSISVYMTSSLACATPKLLKSNVVVITVNNGQTYYRDLDGDGYGNAGSGTTQSCNPPTGYVSNNTDCNDNNDAVNPGHAEVCGNGIDDNCSGTIDENCTASKLPKLITRNYPVKEGDAGETNFDVVVTLDTIVTTNASVFYTTVDEDAKAGQDYVTKSGRLTFTAGSSSATIQLKIIGDVFKEGNERFILRFSKASGLLLNGDSLSHVMIIDDDHNIKKLPSLTVPNMVGRNHIWNIPGIDNFENEVLIMDGNGQLIRRFINYHNQTPVGNLAIGLYFYRITLKEDNGELKTYTGRLLVTE